MKKFLFLSSTFQNFKVSFVGWLCSFFLTWVDTGAKKVLDLIIGFYQSFISASVKNILGIDRMCRFSPTCSEYAKIAINKDGVFEGLGKTLIRILRCQPFLNF